MDSRNTMDIQLGYGGFVIPQHWVPLQIQVNQTIEKARIEIIRINQSQSNVTTTSDSVIEDYIMLNLNRLEVPIFMAKNLKELKIRLFSGSQLVTEEVVDLKTKIFPGHQVLAINLATEDQQEIEKLLLPIEPVLVVPINFRELPICLLNYDGASGLVIRKFKPLLSPAQLVALRSWLSEGGRLVVSGRPEDIIPMVGVLSNS